MKSILMALDEERIEAVDKAAKRLGTTRSAFATDTLRQPIARLREEQLEQKHRLEYERRPVKPGEFDVWESEQVCPA